MIETLLVTLAAGLMGAAALLHGRHMGRLGPALPGTLGLCLGVVGLVMLLDREPAAGVTEAFRRRQVVQLGLMLVSALAAGAFGWWRRYALQRAAAGLGALVGISAATALLHEQMIALGTDLRFPPKLFSMTLQFFATAGAAAVAGLGLAGGLLVLGPGVGGRGLAVAWPMWRGWLRAAVVVRAVLAVGIVLALHLSNPLPGLWADYGWIIALRWLVGLAIPLALLSHRTALRRPGLGVALLTCIIALLVGEGLGLYLTSATGLPF